MSVIFNSLGSNYSNKMQLLALKQLFNPSYKKSEELIYKIKIIPGSQVLLTYKGRHAISIALKKLGINKGDNVALQAFTCWAVEEAIHSICAKPIFIDIEDDSLNFSKRTLEETLKSNSKIKAVIVQHTLGFAAEIEKIKQLCLAKNIILIEDLAHSAGAYSDSKKLLGSYGNATVFSFGRDKIIDGVSGGAVLYKDNKETFEDDHKVISTFDRIRDLLYPSVTTIIRKAYELKIGKPIHFLLKLTPLLVSPIANSSPEISKLPNSHQQLALESFKQLDDSIKHRQKISKIYQKNLPSNIQFKDINIDQSTCLRFPIKLENRKKLFEYLKKKNIYIEDTWFKQPVEKGKLNVKSFYQENSCPNAQKLSTQIVNLPTHRYIDKSTAFKIVSLINDFLKYAE